MLAAAGMARRGFGVANHWCCNRLRDTTPSGLFLREGFLRDKGFLRDRQFIWAVYLKITTDPAVVKAKADLSKVRRLGEPLLGIDRELIADFH